MTAHEIGPYKHRGEIREITEDKWQWRVMRTAAAIVYDERWEIAPYPQDLGREYSNEQSAGPNGINYQEYQYGGSVTTWVMPQVMPKMRGTETTEALARLRVTECIAKYVENERLLNAEWEEV